MWFSTFLLVFPIATIYVLATTYYNDVNINVVGIKFNSQLNMPAKYENDENQPSTVDLVTWKIRVSSVFSYMFDNFVQTLFFMSCNIFGLLVWQQFGCL